MSPRRVLAALIHRPATGPDEIEQWVDGLRTTAPTGGLTALATTGPIDTAAVRALVVDESHNPIADEVGIGKTSAAGDRR